MNEECKHKWFFNSEAGVEYCMYCMVDYDDYEREQYEREQRKIEES